MISKSPRGSPVIWKFRWVVVEPISKIFNLSMIMLNIHLVLETFVNITFVFHSWGICSEERSDFLYFTCTWCKLPPWIRERLFLFPLESSQVSHACAKYTLDCEISYLHSICVPSTPSHWLICSRRRSSFLRVYPMQGLSYPRWWFPSGTR